MLEIVIMTLHDRKTKVLQKNFWKFINNSDHPLTFFLKEVRGIFLSSSMLLDKCIYGVSEKPPFLLLKCGKPHKRERHDHTFTECERILPA